MRLERVGVGRKMEAGAQVHYNDGSSSHAVRYFINTIDVIKECEAY